MIVIGKSKNKNPSYLQHDKSGEKELKWTILTTWYNFQVLYKEAKNIVIAQNKTKLPAQDGSNNDDSDSDKNSPSDEDYLNLSSNQSPTKLRQKLDDEYNSLAKLFQSFKSMNPNLLHSNINKFNDKFNTYLKETIEVQMIKFIPSQFFITLSNKDHTKLVYEYNFTDNLNKEHVDLTHNYEFLKLVHHYINNYELSDKTALKNKSLGSNKNIDLKLQQTATKSRMMNNPVEDSKHLEDESLCIAIEDNCNSLEFCFSGILVRILKIDNMPITKTNETFYLIVVFQRHMKRRRTIKQDKEPNPNNRCYVINKCVFPSKNISDRRIICSSLSKFIEIGLVVDVETFLRVGMEPAQRNKILDAPERAGLQIQDNKINSVIQSYAKYKNVKSTNPIKKLGTRGMVLKPDLIGKEPAATSDIDLKIEQKDESKFSDHDVTHVNNEEFHFESECSSNLLEMSYMGNINNKRNVGGNNIKEINEQEDIKHKKHFSDESTIIFDENAILPHKKSLDDNESQGEDEDESKGQDEDESKGQDEDENESQSQQEEVSSDTHQDDFWK